jgi:hypothetical protein
MPPVLFLWLFWNRDLLFPRLTWLMILFPTSCHRGDDRLVSSWPAIGWNGVLWTFCQD